MTNAKTMTVTMTCPNCGSAIYATPNKDITSVRCNICSHTQELHFDEKHAMGILKTCPCCQRKDFYSQKDFNRKIGVILFIVAAILSIWTYGISFVVLYALDFFLFKKLKPIAICYNCETIFRDVQNIKDIHGFDHEMNDRIVYAGHDFDGRPPEHH